MAVSQKSEINHWVPGYSKLNRGINKSNISCNSCARPGRHSYDNK